MAQNDTAKSTPAMQSRWALVLMGIGLGFLWGTLMWAFARLLGQGAGGVREWLMIAVSMGMIGAGVAAFFGLFGVRRRGERIGPRFRRSRDE